VDGPIVHKDGVVAEDGTSDELLARGGVYAARHRIEYQTPAEQAVTA
jgi:subfamily B ATP-binding cassette protein MsbA